MTVIALVVSLIAASFGLGIVTVKLIDYLRAKKNAPDAETSEAKENQ